MDEGSATQRVNAAAQVCNNVTGTSACLGAPGAADLFHIRIMNPAELRDHCLSFPGAEETFPFGPITSVFKVGGKMFALSQLDAEDLRISLKCEPSLAEQLREVHQEVIPGYHLNKRHWNTVIVGGSLSEQTIKDMIEDSYDLVVSALSKRRRLGLGWQTDEHPR